MQFEQFLQFIISGITSGSIYALIALGFTLIFNSTNIINFAQGEFAMLGGLFAITFHNVWHFPLPLAILLSVLVVTLVGAIFERSVIYPLRKASVISLIISTIGVSMLLKRVAMILWGRESLAFPHFSGDNPIFIGGATILPQTLWILGLTTLAVILLQLFYNYTLMGKAMKATAINKTAASLVGIDTSRMVFYSFALSAALGALAGVIITPIIMTSYASGGMLGLKGFAAAILGGLGNPLGSVLGGILLGLLESLSVGIISSGYKDAIAFIILLLVLFIRPSGILGIFERDKL